MKLLFTATYAQPYLSGITDYIATITRHLSQKHQVTLLTFQHLNNLPAVEKQGKLNVRRLAVHARLSKGLINWVYPVLAWQAVHHHDQVFINLPQVEGIWVALAAKLHHKPLTVIYHCELEFNSGWGQQLIARAANGLARLTCQLADRIVVYTQDYAHHSVVLQGLNHKIVAVLPPVVLTKADKKFSAYLHQKFSKAKPIIGFSGRVSREKGLNDLLAALTQLKNQFPQIQLLCAGPYGPLVVGEFDYYQDLQQRILTENVSVQFLGRLAKSELTAFYELIDVLVLPSVNRTEAFGLVQIEALSVGTPVVTSDLPGVRVAVQMTGGGKITPIRNPVRLAENIQAVLKNRQVGQYKNLAKTTQNLFQIQKTLEWFDQNI